MRAKGFKVDKNLFNYTRRFMPWKALQGDFSSLFTKVCLHYLVTWPILFTKVMTRTILGDLCLELAAKTNFRQKQLFVYKNLFTLLGHMTNFVYKSHDKNYTRLFMPWKGCQGDFWQILEQHHFSGNNTFCTKQHFLYETNLNM